MVTDKLKQLEAAKARLAELQQAVALQLRRELASLPGKYGFESAQEFIAALTAATKGGKAGKARGRGKAAAKSAGAAAKKGSARRKRAVITDATRGEVKKLTEAGKTGSEIAKTVGISLPSVQNIKKALGLVKARK
jgi:hypothetical protein